MTCGPGGSRHRARAFSRVFVKIDAEAFGAAVHGCPDALDGMPTGPLPQVTAHEREPPRREGRAHPAGLLPQAAADGKTMRGAVRPDGSQVHLLSVFDVTGGTPVPSGRSMPRQMRFLSWSTSPPGWT